MIYQTKNGNCEMDCFNCAIVSGNKIPCFMYNVMEALKEARAENENIKSQLDRLKLQDPLSNEDSEICIGEVVDEILGEAEKPIV